MRALLGLLIALSACAAPPVRPAPAPPTGPVLQDNPHRYGRPMLSGPFYATDQRYGVYDTPGTVEVILAGTDPARQVGTRKIVADAEDPLETGIRSAFHVPCSKLVAVYWNVPGRVEDADREEEAIARFLVPHGQ